MSKSGSSDSIQRSTELKLWLFTVLNGNSSPFRPGLTSISEAHPLKKSVE